MRGTVVCVMAVALATSRGAAAERAPGVYPLLVIHPQDDAPHAYILACAKIVAGKKPLMLSAKACVPLLKRKLALEVIADGQRFPVTVRGAGTGDPCPETNRKEPFVTLDGLPKDFERRGFVVAPGEPEHQLDPEVGKLLLKQQGPKISIAPQRSRARRDVYSASLVVDLDGDGVDEVVTENLGKYWVYRADGVLLGSVGCEYG
jgi:hypothetical protein